MSVKIGYKLFAFFSIVLMVLASCSLSTKTGSKVPEDYIVPGDGDDDGDGDGTGGGVDSDAQYERAPDDLRAAQQLADADKAVDDQINSEESPEVSASVAQPNIVLLLLDDTGYMDDRVWERLPNIKRLFIDQGARFTNFYIETSLCCPGRSGYLTGQHTENHGVWTNKASLFNANMTIATQLQKSGYYTLLAGKYLNEFDPDSSPIAGWDRFSGMGGAYYSYWLINKVGKNSLGKDEFEGNYYTPYLLTPEGASTAVFNQDNYSTDVITRKTIKYLKQAPADKPIFAYVTPYAVHSTKISSPHSLPAEKYRNASTLGASKCSGLAKWYPQNAKILDPSYKKLTKPQYIQKTITDYAKKEINGWDLTSECKTLLSVDDLVGVIEAELINQGRMDNTIFILAADNGMGWGAHGHESKTWPSTTQVNFFMHWPRGLGRSSREVSHSLSNIDLAPTLCEVGGCKLGPYTNILTMNGNTVERTFLNPDGKSFLSLLGDQAKGIYSDSGIIRNPFAMTLADANAQKTSLLSRKALLSVHIKPVGKKGGGAEKGSGELSVPEFHALRTTSSASSDLKSTGHPSGLWRYVQYYTGEEELYDTSNGPCVEWTKKFEQGLDPSGDPCELRNLLPRKDGVTVPQNETIKVISEKLRDLLVVLKNEKGSN